jgi:hypothetical protein
MSFNWSEYLSVAEALCGRPQSGPPAGTEARQRTAVSRAYYAGFVSARNRLRDVDGVSIPASGNPHTFVAYRYSSAADSHRVRIGIELRRLRIARNRCDYEDVVRNLPRLERESLAGAALILDHLARL